MTENTEQHEKFIAAYQKKDPEEWTAWRKANYGYFVEKLKSLPRTSKLVDLGAGALHFEDLFLQFDYAGVDFMEYPHVSVIADLTKDIPLPAASADIVILSNTIEHIPNTEHLLRECKRMLRSGGLVIGTVPFLIATHQEPYDFNRYTNFQLHRLLTLSGFSDIEVVPLGKQIDVYRTMETKTFDELYKVKKGRIIKGGVVLKLLRMWRQFEMNIIQYIYKDVFASAKVNEGYGFCATK